MRKPLLLLGIVLSGGIALQAVQAPIVAEHSSSASAKSAFSPVDALQIPRRYAQLKGLIPSKKSNYVAQVPTRRVRPQARIGTSPIIASPLAAIVVVPPSAALLPVIDQPDIRDNHKKIANEVLLSLPVQCRDALESFYVRYDKPERRGLAGKTMLILDGTVPDSEFRALLVHELGHVFDLNPDAGCLGGTPASGFSEFRDGADPVYNDDPSLQFYRISWSAPNAQRAGAKPEDFVSGYAAWDPFEDFSESLAYFVLQNDSFALRAQTNESMAAKYRWFQTYLFPNGVNIATGNEPWNGSVPWDITKLAYTWHPNAAVAQR